MSTKTPGNLVMVNADGIHFSDSTIPAGGVKVVAVTGTTKTLAISDANTTQDCSNASAQTITIPLFASVPFPPKTQITLQQTGVGTVTGIGASGVTINGVNTGSVATSGQYTQITFQNESTDVWVALSAGPTPTNSDGSITITAGLVFSLALAHVNPFTGQQYFAEAALTDGATISWNLSTAQCATVTLAGNRTLAAPTNPRAGSYYKLRVVQDGTGSRTLTWNAAYVFQGANPTLSTTAGAVDIFYFYSDGTSLYCTSAYQQKLGTNLTGVTDGTLTVTGTTVGIALGNPNTYSAVQAVQLVVGTTSADGLLLSNVTAAASGAQQWSPRLHWRGQGWKTTATAASQTVDFIAELQTVQGAATPSGKLVFSQQINGTGYSPVFSISTPSVAGDGIQVGSQNGGFGVIWSNAVTPSSSNFALATGSTVTYFNAPSGGSLAFTIAISSGSYMNSSGQWGFGVSLGGSGALARVTVNPNVTADAAASMQLNATSASAKGLVIQLAATPTKSAQEWQKSDGTVFSSVLQTGDITTQTIGVGFRIKEGTNGRMGTGTLSGGTVTIANTSVTANTRVFVTDSGGGTTNLGSLTTSVSAGTSFTVTSTNALDASTFNWILFEPS